MVDGTTKPPLHCFLTVSELNSLILQVEGLPPVRLQNEDVRKHCRGLNNFYDLFYRCNRGSAYMPKDYNANMINYVQETKRTVVELSTKRKNAQGISKMQEKPKDDYHNGRIEGLIESL